MHETPRADRTPPGFVGGTLDRVDHVRTNPALLAEAFADSSARRLVLDGLDPVEADGHLLLEPINRQALLADHVLLGVAIAFLFADMQARGVLRWEPSWLAFAWLAPLFGRAASQWAHLPVNLLAAIALLALAARRAALLDAAFARPLRAPQRQ